MMTCVFELFRLLNVDSFAVTFTFNATVYFFGTNRFKFEIKVVRNLLVSDMFFVNRLTLTEKSCKNSSGLIHRKYIKHFLDV